MDIELKNTKAFLNGFAQNELIKYFIESYQKTRTRPHEKSYIIEPKINSNVESSGAGGNSLNVRTEDGGMTFNLLGNSYLESVDKGTEPFFPNIGAIKNWLKQKPVKLRDLAGKELPRTENNFNSIAYLIGRRMNMRGIQPANFIGEVVERALKEIKDSIGEPLKSDIMEDLDTVMVSLGYIKKGNTYELKK